MSRDFSQTVRENSENKIVGVKILKQTRIRKQVCDAKLDPSPYLYFFRRLNAYVKQPISGHRNSAEFGRNSVEIRL